MKDSPDTDGPDIDLDSLENLDLSDLQIDTLTGDVRDAMLMRIRDMKRPWEAMTESEQYEVANGLELAAKDMVRGAVRLITAHDFPRAVVKLSKVNIIGGDNARIDATITAGNLAHNRDVLGEHVGQFVAIVAVDSETFFGERAPAKVDKDQPDLDIDGDGEASDDDDAPTDGDEWADLLKKAEAVIRAEEKASTSFLQRRLAVGYNRAAKVIEALEANGVVSPADNAGKRTILPKRKGDAA